MSRSDIGAVLFLDDDTVGTWFRLYGEAGIEGLAGFGHEGSACHPGVEQRERLNPGLPRPCRARRAMSGRGSSGRSPSSIKAARG